jgi:PII-like signaling protein
MVQVQIFIDKDELLGDRKLYEFIMELLLTKKVRGATVFEGQLGFGPNDRHLHRPDQLFSFDEPPMMIVFIDEDDKTKKVLTELRKEFKGGLIITSKVEVW